MEKRFGGSALNIINVITGDLWAGAEVQLYYTINELVEVSNYNYIVILFSKSELYSKLMKNENLTVFVLDENIKNSIQICIELSRLIKNYQPEIVHVHDYKSHIIAAIAKLIVRSNCKIIRTLHGLKIKPHTIKYFKSLHGNTYRWF